MTETTPDLLAMLDMLAADHPDDCPTPTEIVHQDNGAGHIVIWTDVPKRKGEGREYVSFLDMGTVLCLWSGQGADLAPGDARTLAAHLTTWADRAEARP